MSRSIASKSLPAGQGRSPRPLAIAKKSPCWRRHRGVRRERRPEWDEPTLVPVDDGFEQFDHDHLAHSGVLEGGDGGVAEPEAAHHDVESEPAQPSEPDARQGLLGRGEHARHQPLVVELDLEDVDARRWVGAPAQSDVANRGGAEVKLLEPRAHETVPFRGPVRLVVATLSGRLRSCEGWMRAQDEGQVRGFASARRRARGHRQDVPRSGNSATAGVVDQTARPRTLVVDHAGTGRGAGCGVASEGREHLYSAGVTHEAPAGQASAPRRPRPAQDQSRVRAPVDRRADLRHRRADVHRGGGPADLRDDTAPPSRWASWEGSRCCP